LIISKKHIIIIAILVFNSLLNAQNRNKMEMLKDLIGRYSVTTLDFVDNNWIKGNTTFSIIDEVHEGAFLKEEVKYKTSNLEINMLTFIGFDNRISKYKLCAMDKEFRSMDVYQGEFNDENLIFTNLKSDAPFMFGENIALHFRLTYTFTDNGFIHLVEGTKDFGESWFSFSKSIYNKQSHKN